MEGGGTRRGMGEQGKGWRAGRGMGGGSGRVRGGQERERDGGSKEKNRGRASRGTGMGRGARRGRGGARKGIGSREGRGGEGPYWFPVITAWLRDRGPTGIETLRWGGGWVGWGRGVACCLW